MAKSKDKTKEEEAPPAEGAEGEAPKKKGPPMMIIIIAAVAVLVLGGGGAAAYFLLLAPKSPPADAHAAEEGKDGHGKKKDEKGGHGEKKKDEKGGHGGGAEAKVDPATLPVPSEGPDGITYLTWPDSLANMESSTGKAVYLKLKLTFECPDEETVEAMTENKPRIDDILQGFMSELRPEDLSGSQGNYQIRLEILRRINLVLAPHKVNAVLIQEMLIT